jgi:hypothetical protein
VTRPAAAAAAPRYVHIETRGQVRGHWRREQGGGHSRVPGFTRFLFLALALAPGVVSGPFFLSRNAGAGALRDSSTL